MLFEINNIINAKISLERNNIFDDYNYLTKDNDMYLSMFNINNST